MIDLKLWAQAQRAAGTSATEEQVKACYEQLLQEQDVVRAKSGEPVKAAWSDAAREAAKRAIQEHKGSHVVYDDGREGHSGIKGEILHKDEGGVHVQFEDRASPTRIGYHQEDWMKHLKPHVTASEILAQKRAEIIRGGAPAGNKNAAGHHTADVVPNLNPHRHPKATHLVKFKKGGLPDGAIEGDSKFAHAVAAQYRLTGTYTSESAKASDQDMDADVVRCRAQLSTAPVTAQDKPWKQGEPVTFTYMPAGLHTITAGFRKGSVNLTVLVDEDAARAAQRSYDAWRERMPKQKLYGCVEHREQEASVIAKGFAWKDGEGVVISAEPTALGEQNVNGKIHWGWSPSFMTDADYSKAVERPPESGQLVFPDGVRGSASNPARITGISRCVGTLTNNPAFHEMPPVKASEVVQAAGTSAGVRKAWETRKHADAAQGHMEDVYTHADSAKGESASASAKLATESAHNASKSVLKDGMSRDTHMDAHAAHTNAALAHHRAAQGWLASQTPERANEHLTAATDHETRAGLHAKLGLSLKPATSPRHEELMSKAMAHQKKASGFETNASHHDDLGNSTASGYYTELAQHHQTAAEHYEEAAEHAKAGNDDESQACEDKAERHASRAESMKASEPKVETDAVKATASSILKSAKDRAVRASEILRPKLFSRLTGAVRAGAQAGNQNAAGPHHKSGKGEVDTDKLRKLYTLHKGNGMSHETAIKQAALETGTHPHVARAHIET